MQVLVLITSELVTNAVKYGPAEGTIVVRAGRDDGAFHVSVSDDSHVAPSRLDRGPAEVGGHGVRLVQQLASHFDVHLHDGDGKTVSTSLALDAGAPRPGRGPRPA